MASEPTLSTLAALAEESERNAQLYNDTISDPSSSTTAFKAQLKRQYIRTLHKVIDESDIVILVLDARDPEGCRSRLVEEEVRRREHEGKKLVFVLNKVGECRYLSERRFLILIDYNQISYHVLMQKLGFAIFATPHQHFLSSLRLSNNVPT